MKSFKKIMMTSILLLSIVAMHAQIKNQKTDTVLIYGNCSKCKKTIQKAGSVKTVSVVEWNKVTKMATISYDSTKTNQDEILKNIALAGYDSEKIKAKDEDYNNLPDCCQYDRVKE